MYNSIKISNFSLSFPNKVCFENFSANIAFGDHIAITGRNGSGKSSLLKMIYENNRNLSIAYIPQIIEDFSFCSGGERFNKSLSAVFSKNPSILLLDEPTNHLDLENRKNLMRMLASFYGTLLIVTHDEELLQHCIDILWHIDNGKITIFRGKYCDYINDRFLQHKHITHQMDLLEQEKKSMHDKLMKEQKRNSKSKFSGEKKIANKKWMKSTADIKAMKAEKSQGKHLRNIREKKKKLSEQLKEIQLPEEIVPKFYLPFQKISDQRTIVSINDGAIGYSNNIFVRNINLSVMSHERVAIIGQNGSGKTTLIKAIMRNEDVTRHGDWYTPQINDIGYLDQHYSTLNPEKTAVEIIHDTNPAWTTAEIRKHLNDFLFRKNEEVFNKICNLSGGEKARLSLAQIAAKVPKLLILDEITNNLDIETKNHVMQILREYPAAMIIASHDQTFLDEIMIDKKYEMCTYI